MTCTITDMYNCIDIDVLVIFIAISLIAYFFDTAKPNFPLRKYHNHNKKSQGLYSSVLGGNMLR